MKGCIGKIIRYFWVTKWHCDTVWTLNVYHHSLSPTLLTKLSSYFPVKIYHYVICKGDRVNSAIQYSGGIEYVPVYASSIK